MSVIRSIEFVGLHYFSGLSWVSHVTATFPSTQAQESIQSIPRASTPNVKVKFRMTLNQPPSPPNLPSGIRHQPTNWAIASLPRSSWPNLPRVPCLTCWNVSPTWILGLLELPCAAWSKPNWLRFLRRYDFFPAVQVQMVMVMVWY